MGVIFKGDELGVAGVRQCRIGVAAEHIIGDCHIAVIDRLNHLAGTAEQLCIQPAHDLGKTPKGF